MARIKTKKSLENKLNRGLTLYVVFPFSTMYTNERTVYTFDIHSENTTFGTKKTIGLEIGTSDLMTELFNYINPREYLVEIEGVATVPVKALIPTKTYLRTLENNDNFTIYPGFDDSIYFCPYNNDAINYEYGAVFDSLEEANEYCTYAKTIVKFYDKNKNIVNLHNSLVEYLKSK